MGAGDGDRAKLTSWLTTAWLNAPSLSAQTRPLLVGMRLLGQSAAATARFLLPALATRCKIEGQLFGGPKVLPSLIARQRRHRPGRAGTKVCRLWLTRSIATLWPRPWFRNRLAQTLSQRQGAHWQAIACGPCCGKTATIAAASPATVQFTIFGIHSRRAKNLNVLSSGPNQLSIN